MLNQDYSYNTTNRPMPIFQRLNKDQIRDKDLFVLLGQLIWEGYQNNPDYFGGTNSLHAARTSIQNLESGF